MGTLYISYYRLLGMCLCIFVFVCLRLYVLVYITAILYRDVQDYHQMVEVVEEEGEGVEHLSTGIKHLYALALNRRNGEGDRQSAFQFLTR